MAKQNLKLTPWFNAQLHSPVRDGWYDCMECNARHLFKDGYWYRNMQSLKIGPMLMSNMHWRGLAHESLISLLSKYDAKTPRSKEEQAWFDMVPLGREFGSPDYERLLEEDAARFADVTSLKGMFGKPRKRVSINKMNEGAARKSVAT